jgi:glycosyltransferase involved in cell wall biosynthesis
MRICVVSQEYPPGYVGGIGTQSRVKAHGLAALGHDVHVLTAGAENGPALDARDDGPVRLHELRPPGGRFAVYRTETYWLGYAWAVLGALRTLTDESRFDVIDFPDYAAEGVAFQLDRLEDDATAVVVHLHGSLRMFSDRIGWPEPGEPLYRVGTFMEDLSIGAADRLLAASRSIAEFTAARAGLPLELIDVVQGAVDTDVFAPAARSRARDGLELLFVGNVSANKGIHAVFESFIALAPRHPSLSLTVAGCGDDAIVAEMRAEADRAHVGERVRILGFVEHAELPDLYRSADLLAAPSQHEGGLGMVYLEAMACGVPVIASAAGGAAEAVVDGETGLLVEHDRVDQVAAAIESLLGDPALRARMGAAGRARAEREFSVPRYAERVQAAYERAGAQRRNTVVSW